MVVDVALPSGCGRIEQRGSADQHRCVAILPVGALDVPVSHHLYAGIIVVGIGANEVTQRAVFHSRKTKAWRGGPVVRLVPAAVAGTLENLGSGDFVLDKRETLPSLDLPLTAATGHRQPPRKAAFVVVRPHPQGESHLPEVAHARYAQRLAFCFGQCRQKHARQNSDDGDHHQQFDEREGASADSSAAEVHASP